MTEQPAAAPSQHRRQARRNALMLGVLSLALYVCFILYALRHGHA
ncbi:MAG: hypothetical protein ABSH23_11335 [Steroidobacteraceae bacterium]|jgi:cytochrome c-type biogenesis protein CcmE